MNKTIKPGPFDHRNLSRGVSNPRAHELLRKRQKAARKAKEKI